jgi:flagellar hook assembly protein FlgD
MVTRLYPATPNPFNPNTAIKFEVGTAGRVKLDVYDVQGRRVAGLYEGNLEAGPHVMVWNGRGLSGDVLPTGVYVARLAASGETHSQRLVLLK